MNMKSQRGFETGAKRSLGANWRKQRKGDVILHIGKTGGTYLQHVLYNELRLDDEDALVFGHKFKFKDAIDRFPNSDVVFTIREPISMFVSAFNSRVRKGQPTHFFEWSGAEALAFQEFQTPNELAEALSSDVRLERICAEFSMLSILHVRSGLREYLTGVDYLEANAGRIGYILDQSSLDDDIRSYIRSKGWDESKISIEADNIIRHATPDGFSRDLSKTAIANLRRWYAEDIEIYKWCCENKTRINSKSG